MFVLTGVGFLRNMEAPEKEASGGDEGLYFIVTEAGVLGKKLTRVSLVTLLVSEGRQV